MKRFLVTLVVVILGYSSWAQAALGQAPKAAAAPRLELVLQTGHASAIQSLSLSDTGTWLATGSWDKEAILWHTQTGQKVRAFAVHTGSLVSLSGDGKRLVTASRDNTLILWDVQTGLKLNTFLEYVTERVRQLSGGYQHPVTPVRDALRDFPVSRP